MERRFRKFLWTFGTILLGGIAGVAMLNLLVDPFGAYHFAGLRTLQPYRCGVATREAKAELAARGTFDTLLLGSSRMTMGMPTDHPAYGSTNVCNLGLSGTTLAETSAVLDFALKNNPARRVLLGADFHMFSASRGMDPTFEVSRFNPRLDLVEYHGRNLLGARAFSEAWPLFKNWFRGYPPLVGDRGSVPRYLPKRMSQRSAFAKRVRASLVAVEAEGNFVRSVDRLEIFRQMVRHCRQDGVELIVFVPPIHALQLEAVHATGQWSNYEQWKRDLVQILAEEGVTESVPLWDFQGFTGVLAEPVPLDGDRRTRMKYYMEASHFTPALGGLVLDRMLGPAADGASSNSLGVRLRPANLEAHLARTRAERNAYAAQNPAEIAWVRAANGAPNSEHNEIAQ